VGRVLAALALTVLGASLACAQPSNPAGGVFIAHYVPSPDYTAAAGCASYEEHAISDCQEQVPRIDNHSASIWYVLAAFDGGDRVWCGTEFGLGAFDPHAIAFLENGVCLAGAIVIPTEGWPGPNEGIAIAATTEGWSGNYRPVYWFGCYAYSSALIPLTSNPATGFGGFANCSTPSIMYPAACFGAMGLFRDGVTCCQSDPMPHACCVGDACHLVFVSAECDALGGVDHPEWPSCDGDPCYTPPPPPRVCCIGFCDCVLATEDECASLNGVFHAEYDSCDAEPVPPCCIGPVDPMSWGAIKASYR
jgi:hypothetical protein